MQLEQKGGGIMSWKNVNIQLIKGCIYNSNGDSAPFFR